MSKKILLVFVMLALLITIAVSMINTGGSQPAFSDLSETGLIISEVMASNKSVLIDEDGDSPDWIELYNGSDVSVNLTGYGLSDDPTQPGKWLFPNTVIPANSYLLVFASGKNKTSGNEYHASFRIDSGGESLVFSDPQGNIIDQIEIPACDVNTAYGRLSDNPSEWAVFDRPSPGYPNTDDGASSFEATRWVMDSDITISEVMADNISCLQDEDGDYSDWVEISNTGNSGINLAGFALSNDAENLLCWRFPDITLDPGQYIVVFCSGKNRAEPDSNLHTGFKIDRSSDTLFFVNPRGQILSYVEIKNLPGDYSLAGTAAQTWEVTDQPTPGFANTTEGYDAFLRASSKPSDLIIWEVMTRNDLTIPDEAGNYHDWVEIRNTGDSTLNLENYWLSDDGDEIRKWRFPAYQLEPGRSVLVFLSSEYTTFQGNKYLYADFGLSASGDVLYLSDARTVLQKIVIPELTAGVSYGRVDGEDGYFYFSSPTPGTPNNAGSRITGYSEKPVFSSAGGFFSSALSLTITAPQEGAVVHYTTDGSEPGLSSAVLTGSLTIDKTSVVRAIAYKKGYLPSAIVTNTYVLDPNNNLAVVSISTNPENLWDEDTGIYAFGHDYEPEYPYHGANFWQEWEKPAHVEFFEPDGTLGFSLDAGISIHGEYTQGLDQKSFGIDCRKKYGCETINYPVFSEKDISSYQSIVLRNSGQDNGNTKIRDILASQLMKETGLEYQAYRPAILFLNGEYWGFYTLRESTDKHFLASSNPGIDRNNLDIIEGNWRVHQGDRTNYQQLQAFIKEHDMSLASNYEVVKSWMDVDNFIDYQIAVIYCANVDNGNIKFWRERTEGSKWRWILFDFDMAMRYPEHDTVSDVFNPEGTGSDNNFSTVIQMGLLQNQEFRDQFLHRFAYHMKNTFEPQRVLALIDEMAGEIEPEIPRNYSKWKGSYNTWKSCIDKLKNFFVERPEYAKKYIQQYFNLTDGQMKEYGF